MFVTLRHRWNPRTTIFLPLGCLEARACTDMTCQVRWGKTIAWLGIQSLARLPFSLPPFLAKTAEIEQWVAIVGQNMGRKRKVSILEACRFLNHAAPVLSARSSHRHSNLPFTPRSYLNPPLLPVHHVSNANYLNRSVRAIPSIQQPVIQISPSNPSVKRCLTQGLIPG